MSKLYISFSYDDNKILSIHNGFYCSDIHNVIPDNSIEITQEQHQEYLDYLNGNPDKNITRQKLWINNGIIETRHEHSKWDKKKKTFVLDKEAIDAENKLITKAHVRLLIDKYVKNTLPYYFNKYTPQQQEQLNNYLDLLHQILNDEINELPIKPDFLQ